MAATVQVTLTIKPEFREEFLAVLREVMVPLQQEPSCVFVYASESVEEPGKIILFERWLDLDSYLNEILHKDYYQPFHQLCEKAFAAPRVVVPLSPIETLGH